MKKPARYFEIGSGCSTMFARRAINDCKLRTRITSLDPHPRAEINAICDKIIREPMEGVDAGVFSGLKKNDMLLLDGSHRCFQNSDVTTFFLDVLPNLNRGVFVGIHDIFLPYDYPPEYSERFYSEQYLLAACLLSGAPSFDIVFPNLFVSRDPELGRMLSPLWERIGMERIEGAMFWLRVK